MGWLRKKPLYKEIEERYKNEVELPQLQERQAALVELREKYKPVNYRNILNHQRKYEDKMRERAHRADKGLFL